MAQARSLGDQAIYMLDAHMALGESKYRFELDAHGKQKRVRIGEDRVHSLGTKRCYASALVQLGKFAVRSLETEKAKQGQVVTKADRKAAQLHRIDPEICRQWLQERSREVGRTQLNIDRRALEVAYRVKLTPLKSEVEQSLKSRAYPGDQVRMVMQCQSAHNRIATELAYACGLRAHELFTIRPIAEQPPSDRRGWRHDRFGERGRDGVPYTVRGKGGLIREVRVPRELAERLEALRLSKPRDRYESPIGSKERIHYVQHYAIGAGNNWSSSFGAASVRALGWSNGGHGLRHSYAQERMEEEQRAGRTWNEALELISQELGHFREDITLVYLR